MIKRNSMKQVFVKRKESDHGLFYRNACRSSGQSFGSSIVRYRKGKVIFMIKISKKDVESGLKMIGGIMAMVTLGIIAKSLDIPIEFSIGGSKKVIFDDVEYKYTTGGARNVGTRAIQSIMCKSAYISTSYELRRTAEDIYEIAKEHLYEPETLCVATDALSALLKKATSKYDRNFISDLIKEIATA